MKNKRKWIMVALAILIAIGGVLNVYAEETESAFKEYISEELPADLQIERNTYSFSGVTAFTKMSNPSGYYSVKKSQGTIYVDGYNLCIYRKKNEKDESYMYTTYAYNAYGYKISSLDNYESVGTYEYGLYNGSEWCEDYPNQYPHISGEGVSVLSFVYYNEDWQSYNTNVPIFDDMSLAVSFMSNDGTVTIENALNYRSDISPVVFDLEVPKNLKAVQIAGDKSWFDISGKVEVPQFSFQWEQTDPTYKDWTTEIYMYSDFKYRYATLYFIMGDWHYVDDFYMFEDTVQTYKLCWNGSTKKFATACGKMEENYPTSVGGEYEIDKATFYFRNRYYDDGVRHYSNWVVVEYDWETGETISSHIEIEGSEVDIDSDGKVAKPSGTIVEDSQYNGVDYDGLEQRESTDIVGFIEDGFGFLGNGGVIDLISEVFSFIPSAIWGVFIAGISLFVLVAIVKVVF